jgi:hypothetical protein
MALNWFPATNRGEGWRRCIASGRYSGPAWLRGRISLVRDSDTVVIRAYGTAAEDGR